MSSGFRDKGAGFKILSLSHINCVPLDTFIIIIYSSVSYTVKWDPNTCTSPSQGCCEEKWASVCEKTYQRLKHYVRDYKHCLLMCFPALTSFLFSFISLINSRLWAGII